MNVPRMICTKISAVAMPRISGSLLKPIAIAAKTGPALLPGSISEVALRVDLSPVDREPAQRDHDYDE